MPEKFNLNNNPLENENSKEKLTIVEIPKIIRGSYSDGPGEAGYINFTTNPNFLRDKELFQEISTLNHNLELMANRTHLVGMIRPLNNKTFFGVSSPRFTIFPTRKYDQAAISYLDKSNQSAGNIFASSKMFGDYTKKQLDEIQKNDRIGEKNINRIEVGKPIEISEKLISTVQEFIKRNQTLLIENTGEIVIENGLLTKPKGNEIFDCIPIKTMISLYDKLDEESKKEYFLEFTSSMVHHANSKVVLFLQKIDENYKKMYQSKGEIIMNWDDLI